MRPFWSLRDAACVAVDVHVRRAGGALATAVGCDDSPTAPRTLRPTVRPTCVSEPVGMPSRQGRDRALTGWFYNSSRTDQKGPQFETPAGGTLFIFTLGVGGVIAGWDQGVPACAWAGCDGSSYSAVARLRRVPAAASSRRMRRWSSRSS